MAQDIQSKLPTLFDLDVLRKNFGTDVSPTSVVLLQELERFNKLVVRMQRSLAELQRVRGCGESLALSLSPLTTGVLLLSGSGWRGGYEQ